MHGSPERDTEVIINSVILQTSTMAAVTLNNQQITDELIALKGALQSMEATLNLGAEDEWENSGE